MYASMFYTKSTSYLHHKRNGKAKKGEKGHRVKKKKKCLMCAFEGSKDRWDGGHLGKSVTNLKMKNIGHNI